MGSFCWRFCFWVLKYSDCALAIKWCSQSANTLLAKSVMYSSTDDVNLFIVVLSLDIHCMYGISLSVLMLFSLKQLVIKFLTPCNPGQFSHTCSMQFLEFISQTTWCLQTHTLCIPLEHSVCPPLSAGAGGGVEPPTKFSKRGAWQDLNF